MIEQIAAIENEEVDDIPLLLAVIKQMGLIEVFNESLEQHGNWEGLGAGYLIGVWLAYILSTGDHRKSQLEEWVGERKRTLEQSLGVEEIKGLDFTDDRLGIILHKLSDDEKWQRSECEVNQRIVRVYELEEEIARVDTTTASSYGEVRGDGLVQFGYSKDHRPELGQVKIASVTLDPLGLPLVTIPVSGEQADDGLYIPAIEAARKSLVGKEGMLYVGDSKMEAFGTRSHIARSGDSYLMPLSKKQVTDETMLAYLEQWESLPEEQRAWEKVGVDDEQGEEQVLAEGFTVTVVHQDTTEENGVVRSHEWTERRLLVLSPEYAKKEQAALEQRLEQTEMALRRLVERRRGYAYPDSVQALTEQVSGILAAQGCAAYLHVDITATTQSKLLRKYKDRPATTQTRTTFQLHITRQEAQLAQQQRVMGWRAYATNAPAAKLPLATAVEVYRDAYLHEHGYSRLKGKPLSLTPMYLHNDDQITGLIRLLSLALRVLTLIEFVVRKQLAAEGSYLTGVYAGNRNRKTTTPRTETLLAVFKGIILTVIHSGAKEWLHLKPLSATQKRILHLLGMTEEVYTSLVPDFSNVVLKSAN
jgi:transposase